MPGAEKRVLEEIGESRMNRQSSLPKVFVEGRRQKRMRELNRPFSTLDDVRSDCGLEHVRWDAGATKY